MPAILGGCAAPDAEIHLAPIFSRHTVPGYDHAEAAGGILRYGEQAGAVTWALSPFYWRLRRPDDSVDSDFFYPLGRYIHDPARPRTFARLFPLFWRDAETRADGVEDRDWSVLTPFFWGGSSSDGKENYFAFFPVFGTVKNFLTYDEATFVLFPLYLRNRKDERTSNHILWPIVGWTGGSERGWHVFPFYGRAEVPGKYRRSYVLWPIVHVAHDELDSKEPQQGWMVLPLGGRIRKGDYRATTVLWPFFGYAARPSTDFVSWQVWPILKFERGGTESRQTIRRFLPFYMRFEDEQTEFTVWMWPLFWDRTDHFGDITRESFYAMPVYWRSRTLRADGREERRERLWPVARVYEDNQGNERFAALAPGIEPILNSEQLSRNLGFAFEVWAGSSDAVSGVTQRRAFLNLYHTAQAAGHTRWSVPILGGQWTEPDGTVHTSLLLGLLRFRSGPGGGLEEPAFPGPGWPDLHVQDLPPAPQVAAQP
ncbi:MAG: hypothetical protein EYC70_13900 [Planctomycetota bacterium]|nr:MAG: hypothetical protein EYC70_13900 [Planctomycetota bacterium]